MDANATKTTDPITLAVVRNGLMMVANEMDLAQERMSFSPIISEAMDRANGIYRADDGSMIVQGQRALPLFIGVMEVSTQAIIRSGMTFDPGDVVIVNDPYQGGTHLMDVRMLRPFFYRGELLFYLSNTGHWADVGGAVPGGFSSNTTEIQQEGLRITPIKICRRDVLDGDLVNFILANCRVPDERQGDLKAQIGALRIGEERLRALLDKYGKNVVLEVIEDLELRSEREMRAFISKIRDGVYGFSCSLDSDGVVDCLLTVDLKATVTGDEIAFDFSASDPPCKGPTNVPWAATRSAVFVAMKHLFPEIMENAGCFRPFKIVGTKGTWLHAEYPRPVAGAAAEGSQRVLEAVLGAMAQAIPERAYAGPFGTAGNFSLGGYDPESRRQYVMYYFSGGGYGGNYAGDGHANACATISFAATQPVEVLERNYPVLFDFAALREDSGGAGAARGGLGVHYRVRLVRGEASASFMMDHGRTPPFGIEGGLPGTMTEIRLCVGGRMQALPHTSKGSGYRLEPGDWIEVLTPGGGGYGKPSDRAHDLVRRDLANGYISESVARDIYGLTEPCGLPTLEGGA